jgi:pSer/pThr/pTyr-binding forkhead associated (FHA) protein
MNATTVQSAKDLWARARNMSAEALASRYPHPCLLGLHTAKAQEQQGFATVAGDTDPAPPGGPADPGRPVPESQVFPLTKREGVAFLDKITVGRTQNNDLTIRDPLVSKLHGFFTLSEEGPVTYSDGGSSNGTRVNETLLDPLENVPLKSGDVNVFGTNTAFRFLEPRDLYAGLERIFK